MVFTVVGVVGYFVQTAALWALAGHARLPVVLATLVATEIAVLHNFAWHSQWTWADRPAGLMATCRRLLRFNVANGGISLLGAAALMPVFAGALGLHYLLANLLTVSACAVINYLAGDRWVFAPLSR